MENEMKKGIQNEMETIIICARAAAIRFVV